MTLAEYLHGLHRDAVALAHTVAELHRRLGDEALLRRVPNDPEERARAGTLAARIVWALAQYPSGAHVKILAGIVGTTWQSVRTTVDQMARRGEVEKVQPACFRATQAGYDRYHVRPQDIASKDDEAVSALLPNGRGAALRAHWAKARELRRVLEEEVEERTYTPEERAQVDAAFDSILSANGGTVDIEDLEGE